ncbi:MAG: hypothetical protein J6C55_01965, partial [Oscillospiraceae bacterium]|nr:hypothetical protein [Oscillospiraceae bacterium]
LRGFADIVNGYYQYDSEGEVNWVAGISGANAILKDNIEFNDSEENQAKLEEWKKWGKTYANNFKNGSNTEPNTSSLTDPSDIWTPIGDNHEILEDQYCRYTGTFNGNNKTISGLFCNVENESESAYAGLFGYVGEGGEVKNLGIKNSFIRAESKYTWGSGNGGGLIGRCNGSVTNSYSSECTVKVGGLGSTYSSGNGGGLIGRCNGSVTNSYSSGCEVLGCNGGYGYVGGLIGYCNGSVTSCYSSGCEVLGCNRGFGDVGGLIGCFEVSETGSVTNSYSNDCTVEGYSDSTSGAGGLIGNVGNGSVKNSYSTNTEIKATGANSYKGGICGGLGSGATVNNCYYLKDGELNKDLLGVGEGSSDGAVEAKDIEFKNATVLARLNESSRTAPFKQDNEVDQDNKNRGSGYPILAWSERVAYVTGIGVYREYVHPVEKYKLSEKIKIGKKEYSGDWFDSSGTKITEVKTEVNAQTVYGADKILKIPVRVKINYDPSNNLESLVSKDFKHEFFRKKTDGSNWEEMFQNIHYVYTVLPVENSIKINTDGSKTQDFIFNYYIFHAEDYNFGFNKKYPVNTYLKQDVGGGKKLFIDYGVWGRE